MKTKQYISVSSKHKCPYCGKEQRIWHDFIVYDNNNGLFERQSLTVVDCDGKMGGCKKPSLAKCELQVNSTSIKIEK